MASSAGPGEATSPCARPLALVADGDPAEGGRLAAIVTANGFDVIEAHSGDEAVELSLSRRPEVILLDVNVPDGDGLEALSRIRDEDQQAAVVVLSADGEPRQRERALRLGAVNFLRKPLDPVEIAFVLEHLRLALEVESDIRQVTAAVRERRTMLEIAPEPDRVAAVVEFLARELRSHYPGFDLPYTPVRLALFEALANAVEHGTLEIGAETKARALEHPGDLQRIIRERLAQPVYRERRVRIAVHYLPEQVEWTVADDGAGFSREVREAALSGAAPTALRGRGIHLLHHYMSRVAWNERGNEVRLILEIAGRGPRR